LIENKADKKRARYLSSENNKSNYGSKNLMICVEEMAVMGTFNKIDRNHFPVYAKARYKSAS
jgi:hypothetical protein